MRKATLNAFLIDNRYPVEIFRFEGDMRSAFVTFLNQHGKIRGIFVGVRRTDPFCQNLRTFDPTDNGWPSFMRLHPILDWSYSDIWDYLRSHKVPYCSLYDEGYTSLGDQNHTIPNPHLLKPDGGGYLPAYMLSDGSQERAGRI
jgi:3'-phosphoadenosine 5'-phosphosulfate sulfotransferase (PAPS reductase)/FAD synthetase